MYVITCNRDGEKFVVTGVEQDGPKVVPFSNLRTNILTPLRFAKHQTALLIADELTKYGQDIYRVEQFFK